MTQTLPLFPLNTVLYPGVSIALHIFEERYRQMIGECLEHSSLFGIVLIRNGSEVDPTDPFFRQLHERSGGAAPESGETTAVAIGTSARIAECHRFTDGRYYLNAVGMQRFRVQTMLQKHPYLTASVEFLTEQVGPSLQALATELHTLYERFWKTAEAAPSQPYPAEALPEDPIALSYTLAHRFNVDTRVKQRWLEADPYTRLRELIKMMHAEMALFPGQRPDGSRPWSLN